MVFSKTFIKITSMAVLLALCVCCAGGGTSGTGLNTYRVHLTDLEGQGLAGVKVTLVETGSTSITDNAGDSEFQAAPAPVFTFLLESPSFTASAQVAPIQTADSRISIDLTVDPASAQTVEVTQFAVRAEVVGKCARYFVSTETIQQIAAVPDGRQCTLRVKVMSNGVLRGNIPVALQRSECAPGSVWITNRQALTGRGEDSGIAWINFEFFNSPGFCRLRILAPFGYKGFKPIEYPIQTLAQDAWASNR